jgi:hypothetical protein
VEGFIKSKTHISIEEYFKQKELQDIATGIQFFSYQLNLRMFSASVLQK